MLLRRLSPLVGLLALLSRGRLVAGDIEFTRPAGGASVAAGSSLQIEWKDSGDAPSIADLQSYTLFLCAGGNENPIQLATLTPAGQFTSGNKASAAVQAALGASTPRNAYFLKMVSVASEGGTVVNYSRRFTLTGMTGTFPQSVLDGLETVEGDEGPARENTIAGQNNPNAKAGAGDKGPYNVAYTLQSGPTRYAPMQKQAPTKITAKQPTPLYPTSKVPIAKTWLPRPSAVTTLTQSATYSVTSRENDASPAPHPNDDMAKYLARWKD